MALIARNTTPVPTAVLTAFLTAMVAGLAALAGLVALSAPAHAESGYRYWGYYHLTDGEWVASKKGAQSYTPDDGAVEGFRYATTTGTMPVRPPRATATFQQICGGTDAAQDEKRIGVVLDYGTAKDAPKNQAPPPAEAACAVVPADATAQQALESVEPLRIEQGLICAIDGYPVSGCAEQVKDATVPKSEKPVDLALPGEDGAAESGDSGSVAAIVAAAVVVLGGGGFLVARRRAA